MLGISRTECLCDAAVNITAEGLEPEAPYRIVSSLRHRTGTHKAYGVFEADSQGRLDLDRQAPIEGTYKVADGMGLIHSLLPSEDVRLGATVWATPPDPFHYKISLLNKNGEVVDEISHIRHWKHPLVRQEDIENEIFTGSLFLPPGDGPFPTILDFAGTGGGIRMHRGALLASHGFASLALAFFGYKNLPKKLEDVDINYFLDVIDWLLAQPFVSTLGIQGNSFGGIVCCLLADRCDKISSYCIINSIHFLDPNAYILENGKPLPTGKLPEDVEYEFKDNALVYRPAIESMVVPKEVEFQFKACRPGTRFRLVASIDDLSTPAVLSARILEKKIKERGHYVEVDVVPGGHLMEPPSLPHMPYVYAGFTRTYQHYGCDDAYTHGKSQELVWQRTLAFFHESLGKTKSLRPVEARNKL